MQHLLKGLWVSIALFFCHCAWSEVGVNFSSGIGVRDIVPYRLGAWWDITTLAHLPYHNQLNLILEASTAIWHAPQRDDLEPHRIRHLELLTLGPLLRFQAAHPRMNLITPYFEMGVGLSFLSKTEMQGRRLSTHFQFEDKVGLGFRWGEQQQWDMSFRFYHYSNASIKRPNSGVNLAMLSLGYWFK